MENKLLAVVVALALVLSAGALLRPVNVTVPDVKVSVDTSALASVLNNKLGAVSGPDISAPYLAVNGVKNHFFSGSFNKASSTVCSFRSPNSTSTLLYAVGQITTATNTALVWDWGKGTNVYSTTTILGGDSLTVASGAQGTVSAGVASTTYMLNGASIIAPNNYVNLKYGPNRSAASGAVANNGLSGVCKALMVEI